MFNGIDAPGKASLVAQWKKFVCNAGDMGSKPESGRSPGEGNGNPLQCFLLGKPHGWRSLGGTVCEAAKELDMTYRLNNGNNGPSSESSICSCVLSFSIIDGACIMEVAKNSDSGGRFLGFTLVLPLDSCVIWDTFNISVSQCPPL